VAWSHAVDATHPVAPDEQLCRHCQQRAFIRGGKRIYCGDACATAARRPPTPGVKTPRQRQLQRARDARRPNRTERGYGAEHVRERQRQLADLERNGPRPCPLCGRAMSAGMALDLDHVVSLAVGGDPKWRQLTHARCNRQKGIRTKTRLAGNLYEKWEPQVW
jgi:hypothetical protein